MTSGSPQTLSLPASIKDLVPANDISDAILQHSYASLPAPIFNNSLRIFLLARHLFEAETISQTPFIHPSTQTSTGISPQQSQHVTLTALFAAAMFHDFGTAPAHNGPNRFEIEGADAAIAFILSQPHEPLTHTSLHDIWTAITLHTAPGIAERIDPFTRLLRVSVISNFSSTLAEKLGLTAYKAEIERDLPRLNIDEFLPRCIVAQATRGEVEGGLYEEDGTWTDSVKFPHSSWPGVLLRGHLERIRDRGQDWRGPNPAF